MVHIGKTSTFRAVAGRKLVLQQLVELGNNLTLSLPVKKFCPAFADKIENTSSTTLAGICAGYLEGNAVLSPSEAPLSY